MSNQEDTLSTTRELDLLTRIEENPDISQANLASELGVAVGTVNWYLKRLVSKGYVKVKRAQRKKLRYIITPEGIALRARLTVDSSSRLSSSTGIRAKRLSLSFGSCVKAASHRLELKAMAKSQRCAA